MDGFHEVLASEARSVEIPESSDVYGWLIGNWDLEVRTYLVDVREQRLTGEVHFARVLEGRAVQDVWIMPRRSDRSDTTPKTANMYGMTLRVWDASIGAWRVTWINPVTGQRNELIGRRVGDEIVQVGSHADGTSIRWRFTDVTPDSFRWIGEALQSDGVTWKVQGDFLAKRRSAAELGGAPLS